jgi:hypothetical protein
VPRSHTVPLALVSVLVLAVLAAPVPAGANVITRTDGNDTAGPLDLASVRVSHATGASVFRITTRQHFRNSQINRDRGLFEVDFDTNADRKANFYAIVFFRRGGMRSWLFKGNGDRIAGTLSASRVSRRAVQVTVPLAKIGNPKSYDFAAFSAFFATPCRSKAPCIDSIPNRFPLIRHDLTGPKFTWNPIPPTYSTDVTANLAFPVGFTVKDDRYGSGVKDWTLQREEVGTATWVTVKVGTKLAATPKVTGVEQGKTYDLRVIVRDHQGNKTISTVERTSVPYDDGNTFFEYSASWTSASGVSGAFLGTTHAAGLDETVGFVVESGQELCILGGPTAAAEATAHLVVGGGPPVFLTEETNTAARTKLACVDEAFGPDTLVLITVTSAEPFVFDGAAVLP